MPRPVKYREIQIRGMLHIIWVTDTRMMCNGKGSVEGYAVWDVGACPGLGVYCKECIKKLLAETGVK